jgi:hypothetical protein
MKRPRSEIAAAINPDSVLVVDEAVARERADSKSEDEASLLALIDGKRTVAEVLRMSRMSGFVAMRRLRSLLEGQVVRPAGRAPTAPAGMPVSKPGRLGLTQDLTSAAVSFAAQAAARPKKPADAEAGADGAKAEDKPRPGPGMTAPPVEARPTPLQGGTALPSVIITFGPDFLDARNMPTRRLPGTAPPPPEKQSRPTSPGASPMTTAEALDRLSGPDSVALIPVTAGETAMVSQQKTAMMPRANGRRLKRRTPATAGEIEAQELWLSVTRRDWQTLAVIPAHRDGSALSVATALAEAGSLLRGKPVELFSADRADSAGDSVLNARATSPITLNPVPFGGLPPSSEKFGRVVALEPLSSNPAGATIAQAAQAVLMVAERGVTELRVARRTMEMIGRDLFVGCVLISRPAK